MFFPSRSRAAFLAPWASNSEGFSPVADSSSTAAASSSPTEYLDT